MKENIHLINLLRERKLKATSTRLAVLSVIANCNKAIPFSQIQNALHDFDRVTLYRTLQALMENGIIHKVLIDEREIFFALCNSSCSLNCHNHQHIHFKCSKCKVVSCQQTDKPFGFSIPGYSIEHLEIVATGICPSCKL